MLQIIQWRGQKSYQEIMAAYLTGARVAAINQLEELHLAELKLW